MTLSVRSVSDVIAILPAAGIGKRMQISLPKQYLTINNKTILEHAIDVLLFNPSISKVIVAIHSQDRWYHKLPIAADSRISVVTGGETRADSVMAALDCIDAANWVLVHDAVRPCLHHNDLNRILDIKLHTNIGGVLAAPVRDTIKYTRTGTNIIGTVNRNNFWYALTPQLFVYDLLKRCLQKSLYDGIKVTDESSALEYCGYIPLLVPGRSDNIKITFLEDLALARVLFSKLNNIDKVS